MSEAAPQPSQEPIDNFSYQELSDVMQEVRNTAADADRDTAFTNREEFFTLPEDAQMQHSLATDDVMGKMENLQYARWDISDVQPKIDEIQDKLNTATLTAPERRELREERDALLGRIDEIHAEAAPKEEAFRRSVLKEAKTVLTDETDKKFDSAYADPSAYWAGDDHEDALAAAVARDDKTHLDILRGRVERAGKDMSSVLDGVDPKPEAAKPDEPKPTPEPEPKPEAEDEVITPDEVTPPKPKDGKKGKKKKTASNVIDVEQQPDPETPPTDDKPDPTPPVDADPTPEPDDAAGGIDDEPDVDENPTPSADDTPEPSLDDQPEEPTDLEKELAELTPQELHSRIDDLERQITSLGASKKTNKREMRRLQDELLSANREWNVNRTQEEREGVTRPTDSDTTAPPNGTSSSSDAWETGPASEPTPDATTGGAEDEPRDLFDLQTLHARKHYAKQLRTLVTMSNDEIEAAGGDAGYFDHVLDSFVAYKVQSGEMTQEEADEWRAMLTQEREDNLSGATEARKGPEQGTPEYVAAQQNELNDLHQKITELVDAGEATGLTEAETQELRDALIDSRSLYILMCGEQNMTTDEMVAALEQYDDYIANITDELDIPEFGRSKPENSTPDNQPARARRSSDNFVETEYLRQSDLDTLSDQEFLDKGLNILRDYADNTNSGVDGNRTLESLVYIDQRRAGIAYMNVLDHVNEVLADNPSELTRQLENVRNTVRQSFGDDGESRLYDLAGGIADKYEEHDEIIEQLQKGRISRLFNRQNAANLRSRILGDFQQEAHKAHKLIDVAVISDAMNRLDSRIDDAIDGGDGVTYEDILEDIYLGNLRGGGHPDALLPHGHDSLAKKAGKAAGKVFLKATEAPYDFVQNRKPEFENLVEPVPEAKQSKTRTIAEKAKAARDILLRATEAPYNYVQSRRPEFENLVAPTPGSTGPEDKSTLARKAKAAKDAILNGSNQSYYDQSA